MANSDIGFITRENFLKLLPERVPVRKSSKETAKFPLYCHCPILGPVSVNTRAGQDVILENAVMFGPEGQPQIPEVVPEKPGIVDPVVKPEPAESFGLSGFIKSLGDFDE